jgi:hypothetical protein
LVFQGVSEDIWSSSKDVLHIQDIWVANATATNLANKRRTAKNRADAEKKEANAKATKARKSKLAKMAEVKRKAFKAKQSANSAARENKNLTP